ncbi:MAG: hypothetical protein AAB288_14250 [Acidobacteriota bacterium]|mgnify:CR=1 FL=1
MRKATLLAVSFFIAFPIVYFGREILWAYDRSRYGYLTIGLIVVGPVVLLILTPLNRRLLEFRKARGRDIEDEERYESDHGMISLNPKDKDERTS